MWWWCLTLPLCWCLSLCRRLSLDGCLLPEDPSALLSSPITHLSLKCCSLSDAHCATLGPALSDNNHLISLNLACNRIGDEGMKQLVKGLRVNRALLLLSLTQNYISDVGAGMLAEVRDGVGWVGGWVCLCLPVHVCGCLCVWGGVHWYMYVCTTLTLSCIVAVCLSVRLQTTPRQEDKAVAFASLCMGWWIILCAFSPLCTNVVYLQALSDKFVLTHEEIVQRRRLLVSAVGWGGEEGGVDLDASTVGLTPRNSLTMQASPDKHGRGSKLDRGSAKQVGKKDSAKKDDKGGKKEEKSRRSEQHRTEWHPHTRFMLTTYVNYVRTFLHSSHDKWMIIML